MTENTAENMTPDQQPAGDPNQPPAARIAQLEAELIAVKDQALRTLAEADNVRKRAQKERDDATKYATSALAKELLGVADNLRRALEASGTLGADAKGFIEGVEATERQLLAAFDRCGIKKIEPLGEVFDPNFHRVMIEVENTDKPAGTVVQVLQAGYVIHDRLLREALVGVAKGATGAGGKVDTTG